MLQAKLYTKCEELWDSGKKHCKDVAVFWLFHKCIGYGDGNLTASEQYI